MIRNLFVLALTLLSSSAFAGTLLTEKEKSLIPHFDLSFGVTAMLASDFEKNAESTATIVFNGSLRGGGGYSIIERDGERAIILDNIALFRLKKVSMVMFDDGDGAEPAKTEAPVCSSSCVDDMIFGGWDGFISGGSGGAAIGGALGAAGGFAAGGPPGAAAGGIAGAGAGAAVGGAVGAGIGAAKGGQSCDKEKEAAGCPAE